jgi:outer membrane protein TolC
MPTPMPRRRVRPTVEACVRLSLAMPAHFTAAQTCHKQAIANAGKFRSLRPGCKDWNKTRVSGVVGAPKYFSPEGSVLRPFPLVLLLASLLSVSALAAEPAAGTVVQGPSVSLKDAVVLALNHAFSARIATYREASAAARVGEAQVAFVPDFSASLNDSGYSRYPNPNYIYTPPGGIPKNERYGKSLQADLNANYVLLNTTRRLDLQAAQLTRESQGKSTEAAKRTVVRDTARAYLQVVQSDALLRTAEQDVTRRQHHKDEANALVRAGRRAEYEVIRADADLAAGEANLIEVKNNVKISRSTLAQVIGTALPLDFVATSPAPPVDPRTTRAGESADQMISASVKARPDVQAAQDDADVAHIGYNRSNRAFFPSLSLYARYSKFPTPAGIDAVDSSFTYGALLEIRFSTVLNNLYATKDTLAQAHLQAVVADQTRVAVSLDVERAMLELDRYAEVKAATMKSLEAARRNYETAAERYRLGVATQTEQVDAESGLVDAEVNAVKSDVGYRTALWNLRFEMGVSLDVL